MRNLQSYNKTDAEKKLRAGEVLMPAGGITLNRYLLDFFSAVNDEDLLPKEERLIYRRKKRQGSKKRGINV